MSDNKGISRPYKRTIRQLKDGSYANGGHSQYIMHKDYANSPERIIQAYLLLLKDIRELFEYVEPSNKNKKTYSYRIHGLFVRTCIEVEANFKAILSENGYTEKNISNYRMSDYKLVNLTHKLSDYELISTRWIGTHSKFVPFKKWKTHPDKYWWYQYFNDVKHDIHNNFVHANLKNLMEAVSALTTLISSQFYDKDFVPSYSAFLFEGSPKRGYEIAIGGMFLIKYPVWDLEERYSFDWSDIKDGKDAIQCHDYNSLKKARDKNLNVKKQEKMN